MTAPDLRRARRKVEDLEERLAAARKAWDALAVAAVAGGAKVVPTARTAGITRQYLHRLLSAR